MRKKRRKPGDRVLALICAYQDEALLPGAIESLHGAGIAPRDVHVFDGAWSEFWTEGPSEDGTVAAAKEAGAKVHRTTGPWPTQEYKRTFSMHNCGAQAGDHLLIFDSDELLEGTVEGGLLDVHMCVNAYNLGPNDIPELRGVWPHGDYSAEPTPRVKLLAYNKTLWMKEPGRYVDRGAIVPSDISVLQGIVIGHRCHEREPERIDWKISYYEHVHQQRVRFR